MKTTLTPEQSATLIAKGISADKATRYDNTPEYCGPIFYLEDLLSLLPKELKYDSLGRPYILHIEIEKDRAIAAYRLNYNPVVGADKRCAELIDSLFSLLCWAIDNGHIDLPK